MSIADRTGFRFRINALPEDEHLAGFEICNLISSLRQYIKRFEACLALAAFVEQQQQQMLGNNPAFWTLHTWGQIATRDAGMTIHDFKQAMVHTKALRNNSKTISQFVPIRLLEQPVAIFSQHFRNAKSVRNAMGHPSDITGTMRRNSFSGDVSLPGVTAPSAKDFMINGTFGDKVAVTIENRIETFEFNESTVIKLNEVELEFWKAFNALDAHLNSMGHPSTQQPPRVD